MTYEAWRHKLGLKFVSVIDRPELQIIKSEVLGLVEDFNYKVLEKMGRVPINSAFKDELGAGFTEVLDDIARELGESKIVVYGESYNSREVIDRFVELGAELKAFAE